MKTESRPELKEPVLAFAEKLAGLGEGGGAIPLADLAAMFGATGDVLERVRARGDLRFSGDAFSNDGPDLTVGAGRIELEIPSLLRGTWSSAGPGGFTLAFPSADFTVRACAQVAIFRKCFDLEEVRATADAVELDFGGSLADRRFTF